MLQSGLYATEIITGMTLYLIIPHGIVELYGTWREH